MNSYRVKEYMWILIVLMFITIACLSGCSTVAGVGKDNQSSAEWTKEKKVGSK
jgi:predicted small secreted protein